MSLTTSFRFGSGNGNESVNDESDSQSCTNRSDSDESSKNEASDAEEKEKTTRSFFNEYLLLWAFPILWKGFRNCLDPERNSPPILDKLKAENIVPAAIVSFKKHKSLYRVMWDLAKVEIVIGLIASVMAGLLTVVCRPLLLGLIVQEMSNEDRDLSVILQYIGVLCLVLVFEGWTTVIVKHSLTNFGGSIYFTACAGLIQEKSQRIALPSGSSQEASLIGNDVFRTYDNLRFSVLFPMACTGLIGGVTVLILTIGEASIVGLIVMVIVLCCNSFVAKLATAAEEKDLLAADKRLAIMKQMITGIKAIKLCAWEENFLKTLFDARDEELKCLTRYRLLAQSGVQLGRASPVLCAASSFLYLAITGANVTPAELFASLNVFLALRLALIIIPECITYFGAAMVSTNRIHAFLNTPDMKSMNGERQILTDCPPEKGLSQTGIYRWGGGKGFKIEGEFKLPPGKSLAVISQVGHGKTSLLHSIIGELFADSPESKVVCGHESISFIPQHAFIISGTVLENIVMDCDINELERILESRNPNPNSNKIKKASDIKIDFPKELKDMNEFSNKLKTIDMQRVNEVVRRSALEEDLKLLSDGLYTKIGERGVTLSGGQQQRLVIARALYHNPTLIVADDPLAAVDTKVADHLFEHAFMKHISKTAADAFKKGNPEANKSDAKVGSNESIPSTNNLVMTLNQPRFLPYFDYICKLDAGKIVMFDTVNERSLFQAGTAIGSSKSMLVQRTDSVQSEDTLEDELPTSVHTKSNTKSVTKTVKVMPVSGSSSTGSESEFDSKDGDNDKAGELVEKDYQASGRVSGHVITTYLRGMGYFNVFLCCVSGLLCYSAMAFTDLWLSNWVDDLSEQVDETDEERARGNKTFAIVYSVGSLTFLLLLLTTSYLFSISTAKSSKSLHNSAIIRLMHAPITWYEQTPSGRIMSRFTSDLSSVDQTLSRFCDNLWQLLATLLALIVVVAILVPPIAIVIFISIAVYSIQVVGVDRANRVLKREANVLMSPVQMILNEGIDGRVSNRVMKFDARFTDKFYVAVDNWNRQSFASLGVINTSMLNSYILSLLISASTALYIVFSDNLSPSLSGLALTYSFLIPYFLLHSSFVMTLIMTSLSSLERLMDYIGDSVPQEPSWYTESDPVVEWPETGQIEFQNVSLVYRKGLDPAIKNISFSIRNGEKIGIIGRTGAGKSSIILLLLRILDPSTGCIKLDGIDTTTIGLLRLRRAISIIPQRPLLLKGTVQDNVAPFGGASFDKLKTVLTKAGLVGSLLKSDNVKDSAENILNIETKDSLVQKLLETDANSLSAGQKQLLSLARCLMNPDVKVLVCDEPTSNVDVVTDEVVQKVLRSEFKKSTCITIAHRLETISDSDRILVMEKGEIAMFETPDLVLSNKAFENVEE